MSLASPGPEIRVAIPRALHSLCDFSPHSPSPELTLHGADVRALLLDLLRRYPRVHVRLCDERGDPRPHINVFVNDDHVRVRAGLDTPLAEGDLVSLLPAVSGG